MAALRLEGITKSYGDAGPVVRDLSLSIGSGEFVTLLGPSGCGKSTTLKIVAGLVAPDRGRVALGGRDVTALPASARGVGMVFQNLALFPHLTAAENVAFGLRMRGLPRPEIRRRVDAALELVRMQGFEERLPAQLSGGQQQRVALARACAIEPTVLLLDEPLGALDRKLREEMQVEIRALTRRLGVTALFVTHDQEEALVLSDRVAVMNHGVVEQLDRPQAVFRRPATAFVAGFMGVANLFPARVAAEDPAALALEGAEGLRLRCGRRGTPGAAVMVGLRPEDALLAGAGATAPDGNAFAATVLGVVYPGAMVTLALRPEAAPGLTLTARVAAAGHGGLGREPAPGEPLQVGWRPSDVLVYSGG
jgi:ABC-type Fe3+/spermidine/putrescine transport system ATPase subunit